jgi:hypothetical protein
MHFRQLVLVGALALAPLALASRSFAEDTRPASAGYVLVFPDNGARFHVTRDLATGTMVFTTADSTVITEAPVFTLRSASSPKDVTVTAVAGERGTWRVTHDLLKSEQFDGTMVILAGGKKYTSPLVLKAVRTPRHGGQLISLCSGEVEVVHDLSAGTLMVYTAEDVKVSEPPVVALTEPKDAGEVKLTAVAGEPNAWQAKNDLFKSTKVCGVLKAKLDGRPCEAELVFIGAHGGRIVKWQGGPRYELVADPNAKNGYTIYFLDETWDGKAYTIENPEIVWGTGPDARTVRLEPIPDEPRAYRVADVDGGFSRPGDARLRLTLFGKTLETGLGVSGLHLGVR